TSSPSAANPNDTSTLSAPIAVSNPFVVTTTSDNGDNLNPILGSLRQVILSVDGNPKGPNSITFAIPADLANPGTGTFEIDLVSALPNITAPVQIDGTTESTFLKGQPATVVINGGGAIADGLVLTGTA